MPKSPRTTTPAAKAPASRQKDGPKNQKRAEHTTKVDLPFVTAEFHAPHLPRMRPHGVVAATRALLPSPRAAVYYGGLALLAAIEVLEWPVAVAIGVGAAVMGHGAGEGTTKGQAEKGQAETRQANRGQAAKGPGTHEGDGHQRARTPARRSTSAPRRK